MIGAANMQNEDPKTKQIQMPFQEQYYTFLTQVYPGMA